MIDLFERNRNGNTIADSIDAGGACWEWTAAKMTGGYGHKHHGGRKWAAHVLVYQALVGPIPEGMELDHLCRNTACCNPDHLEPVTHQENLKRGANQWQPRQRNELGQFE